MFTSFRLPDTRWFPLIRDRQKRSSGYVYPQYPAPVHFNTSGYVDPRSWHGYTSQANPRGYHPSQLQGQYQSQQHQQTQNRYLPQTSQTAQPYFYPNPRSYYRHHSQHRPQDNHQPGYPYANFPSNNSHPYLTPQSVQSSNQQSWTPFSNVSRVSLNSQNSHTTTHRKRSHSQGSTTRRTTSGPSSAPHIRSRMLNIPLVHPLVCGHRHSLIPNQIPETEVLKPERSVWDSQHFSLPPGIQAPMMINVLQVRSLSLDWDITLPPSFAREIRRDGQVFNPPRHLHLPLIHANFNSEVCIKTRQDNPLTKCFLRWGCIVVESRDPNGIPPTMKQFLHDIWEYFHTALTEEERLSFTRDDLAKLYRIVESRAENYAREGEQSPDIRVRGPTRLDVLCGYTRFAGLEVCPRFADTGDLFLYLEPL